MVCGGVVWCGVVWCGGTRIYVDGVSVRAVPVTTTQYQPEPQSVKVTSTAQLTSPQSTSKIFHTKHYSLQATWLPYSVGQSRLWQWEERDERTCKPMM